MKRKTFVIKTEKQFHDLNHLINEFIKDEKGLGMVNIFTKHTTCAIKIIENELLLLADINEYLDETFPKEKKYMHDRIEIRDVPLNERINGVSHLRQLNFTTSETLPVSDGKMDLGKWQTVFLIEFDPIREREVLITYWS